MDQPGTSSNIRKIAERLLAYEAPPGTSELTGPAAVRICEKLARLLGKLIGREGSRALFTRALNLAKRETEALAQVRFTDEGALEGLTGDAAEASSVLIAHLIGLVVTFLGEALTLRLLHDVWPDHATLDNHLDERNANESAK